jgi:hypothetical protein
MSLSQQNIISKLKQQPRHGMADDIGGIKLLATLKTSFTELTPLLTMFNDENVQMNVGLSRVLGTAESLIEKFKNYTAEVNILEQRNKELNKSFGINSIAAAKLSNEITTSAEKLGVSTAQMKKYVGSIKSIVPTIDVLKAQSNDYYQGLARVQQVLTTNLGLTEEQAASYSLFAGQGGKNAEDQLASQAALAAEIERTTGMQGSFKVISEGIAETTADLQLQYGRIPGSLEVGILKAKALGFAMADLNKTADNLLNIESSIGQELEYQLLSGHRLVDTKGKSLTNSYREATLQGNASKQADTLNTILEQEGDTLKNNLFARKQMSELLGMDEASLSRALQKKSILESLPGGESLFNETGDALLEAAKTAGATKEQIDALVKSEDTRTTDQKIEQTLAMMVDKGIKAQLVDQVGAVTGASTASTLAAKNINMPGAGASSGAITALGSQQIGVDYVQEMDTALKAAKDFFKNFVETITNANNYKLDKSKLATTKNVDATFDDFIATPTGYGDRILLAGEDTFALNNNDTIVGGTNLGGGGGGGDDKLSQVMMQVGAMIVSAINRKQTEQLFSGGINAPTYG